MCCHPGWRFRALLSSSFSFCFTPKPFCVSACQKREMKPGHVRGEVRQVSQRGFSQELCKDCAGLGRVNTSTPGLSSPPSLCIFCVKGYFSRSWRPGEDRAAYCLQMVLSMQKYMLSAPAETLLGEHLTRLGCNFLIARTQPRLQLFVLPQSFFQSLF